VTTQPATPADLAAHAAHQRVQRGIEAACAIIAARRREDIDAVHALTADMTRESLRQIVATLAAMIPATTRPMDALRWLEES
jgi:hypothetical protein